MIPMHKRLLLVFLVLLASGLGYAWVTSQVDDSVQSESVIETRAPGAVTAQPTESWADTATTEKHLEATPERQTAALLPARLIGRIVDEQGRGLADVKIRIRTTRGSGRRFILRQASSDENGGFVFVDLDQDSIYMMFTDAFDGYPAYRLDGFTLQSLPTPFEIRLARAQLADIAGTIVDAEHAPVANFNLTIESLDSNYPTRTITSDASGYFRLRDFPTGALKIYTATPEYFRIQGLRTNPNEHGNLTLVIDRGHYEIGGRILDENGQPVEDAQVKLNSMIEGTEYRSHAFRTRMTDASGKFEFTGLGGLTHTLGVYANGYKPHVENHEFQSFSDYIEITLRR